MKRENSVKNMKTLFVVDDSSSVCNQDIYFNKVLHLISANFYEERGDAFYIWNQDMQKLSYEDIFREHIPYSLFKGFSRKIYTDDRTSEKDNSSFCIYAYRGLEGFYILINDCKGNILAPPDWQTLKEFNNGKKVYYDKPF